MVIGHSTGEIVGMGWVEWDIHPTPPTLGLIKGFLTTNNHVFFPGCILAIIRGLNLHFSKGLYRT
jgi:hypothetical protein